MNFDKAKGKMGVYVILNWMNDNRYIGSSQDMGKRGREHNSRLIKNKHHSQHLQNAWNLYGEDKFIFEIIEECGREDLIQREQYWIDYYKSNIAGYNMADKAGFGGCPPSLKITIEGMTKPLPEWCATYNIKKRTVWARHKAGWTWEESIKTPVGGGYERQYPKVCEHCGEEFMAFQIDQKFCNTPKCRASKRVYIPRPKVTFDCVCKVCGKQFHSRIPKTLTGTTPCICSSKCRSKDARLKKKALAA